MSSLQDRVRFLSLTSHQIVRVVYQVSLTQLSVNAGPIGYLPMAGYLVPIKIVNGDARHRDRFESDPISLDTELA